MSVPVRSPNFLARYPTKESFEEAIAQFISVSEPHQGFVDAAPETAELTAEAAGHEAASRRTSPTRRKRGLRRTSSLDMQILSESEGLIDTLLLSVPKFNDAEDPTIHIDPRHAKHLGHLFKVFGNSVRFVIVAAPTQQSELGAMLSAAGAAKVDWVLSPNFNLSIWAQDAHIAFRTSRNEPVLCEGVAFNRFEDMSVADDVELQTDVLAEQSILYFQGGNVLGGSKITLIGRDYVWRNTGRHGMEREVDVLNKFACLFNTRVVTLGEEIGPEHKPLFDRGVLTGYGLQPIFHIDMYVTRTGVEDEKSGKEIVFLGRPALAKEVTNHFSDFPEFDDDTYDTFFKRTEEQLQEHFVVRHLPLWLTYGNLRDPKKRLKFYNLTWNNALVENDGKTRRVLLPSYTDPEDARIFGVDVFVRRDLQQAACEAWQNLGFDVRFTDDMEDLAWGDGAIHCMTKTLGRTAVVGD